ncbi:hypothetical protein CXG81DRAFT_8686 [Caulochytrium protostelioides]|uniref:SCP domain-containing protein n=1 Tax=Caulochytrium protostelioides TaxID=1555241 RepID=A0A4P9XG38_9FUNG|nr:hypothetical protein CXG81DRAFT_8686 [Caulochytrium protostelioides]|eukprot:RKP04140.1 hypothetical protein CXG81DRAFT_8686 [Caulochytrium protostelioides]
MTATPPDAWAQACMEEHNRLRRKFGKADLQWSPRAASYAQIWSNILNARQTGLAHSHGMFPGYGENLYSGTPSCRDAVRAWGAEAPLYNGEPIGTGDFEGYGHFTQAIWPDTTAVGCAISGVTITCEYYPAGNFQGEVVSKH